MRLPSFFKTLALAVFVFGVAFAPQAVAQAITTSALAGVVLGGDGLPVAGAPVAIVHEPTGSDYSATTRPDGTFSMRGLRPGGPYTIVTSPAGQPEMRQTGVYLDIDRGAQVTLRPAADQVVMLEALEVSATSASQLLDPSRTGAGAYLGDEDIRNLPAGDRSINGLARLDPRITYNRDPQDRAISVSGISNRYNSIQVDGVNASDPFGINGNNMAAERNVIPLDSLEALSVNTSPYNTRSAGFVGAQINAITKSGTKEFKGSAYYTYRGRSAFGGVDLVGTKLDDVSRPLTTFSEQTLGATLGGPIIPKRLFFYLAYEDVNEDRIAPSPIARTPAATVEQIRVAAEQLGFKPGSAEPPSGNKLTDKTMLAKIDWTIVPTQRASFRYSKTESSRPTFPGFGSDFSENNFSFDSSWYQEDKSNESFIGQLISQWSEKLNTEISVSRSTYHSEPVNASRQPYVQVRDVVVPGSSNTAFVTFGTEQSRHANVLNVRTDTTELFAAYEFNERHTLQTGLQYDTADVYNLFVQNAYGFYDFANLAQLLSVAANNNGTVNYRTYTYNQILPGVEAAASFTEQNAGVFLTDTWRITPSLRIDVGARLDRAALPDEVPYNNVDTNLALAGNQNFESIFGMPNNATYDGKKILQPRIGFNWQPAFKRTTIVRGGFGLFYGRTPRVWIANSYSNTGMNFRTWSAGTNPSAGNATQAPVVTANPAAQSTTGNSPAMSVNFMDPNFELPSRYKTNFAVEHQVGYWDLNVSAELEITEVRKDVFYQNMNIAETRSGPDGRALYWNAYGATATGTRLVSTAFTNRIMKVGNTEQGGTRAVTLSIERPRKKDGWYWKASYVNTRAEEILFGTSSTAASNWNNRAIFNANAEELHKSELEIRDRFLITLTKDVNLLRGFKTTVSLLYDGHRGYPFSFVYSGDTNGDSQTRNDLVYIPDRNGDSRVRFATPLDRENFYKIVDRFELAEGATVRANEERYPWVNQFDFSLKQEVKLPFWRHKLILGADILNVGNLLNNKWGVIHGSNQFFSKKETIASASYDGVANQYVYSFVNSTLASGAQFSPALGRGEPAATRWTVLFTARYEF